MDSSLSQKDEIWFLRVCHHISTGPYLREGPCLCDVMRTPIYCVTRYVALYGPKQVCVSRHNLYQLSSEQLLVKFGR